MTSKARREGIGGGDWCRKLSKKNCQIQEPAKYKKLVGAVICHQGKSLTKGGSNPITVLPVSERLLWTLGRDGLSFGQPSVKFGIN